MKKLIYPPNRILRNLFDSRLDIFLAGSIEMGTAGDWQTQVYDLLPEDSHINVFNPRRRDWDSSWKQSKDNPQFYEQVNWELDHIEQSQIVFFYFDPDTKSPSL